MKKDVLDKLLEARAGKLPVATITDLDSGAQALVGPDGLIAGDAPVAENLRPDVEAALRADKGVTVEKDGRRLFIHPHNPPLRMAIVGAVHIAQALAPMAALAGYAVTVIDPRHSFATEDRFPGVELTDEWPDDALDALKPDRRTAVVTLTHDPKMDDPALERALASDCFYIGALGSTRTHASRLARLERAGIGQDRLARIHGPIGLAIGAKSPAEIAISIMAEVTDTLRNPDHASGKPAG